MSLTETKVLSQISVLPEDSTVNVKWDVVIKRGDEEVLRTPHRKAYSKDQKEEFVQEVPGASKYLDILGW